MCPISSTLCSILEWQKFTVYYWSLFGMVNHSLSLDNVWDDSLAKPLKNLYMFNLWNTFFYFIYCPINVDINAITFVVNNIKEEVYVRFVLKHKNQILLPNLLYLDWDWWLGYLTRLYIIESNLEWGYVTRSVYIEPAYWLRNKLFFLLDWPLLTWLI